MKYKVLGLLFYFAFAKAEYTHAQTSQKIERETRIDQQDFPPAALPLINSLNKKQRKVKFYKEYDGENSSYEAKFKRKGHRYSAEFNTSGMLQDLEIKVKFKKLPDSIKLPIIQSIESEAKRYRIEKTQVQLLVIKNDVSQLLNKIKYKNYDGYELIVAFKVRRKIYRKELQFNKKGTLVNSRTIKRNEYDFILF